MASRGVASSASIWLWLSVPIAIFAIGTSISGIATSSAYSKETPNWAGQAAGQDIANLVAYPTLLVLAYLTSRGSVPARLAWTGVVAYSAYTFAIYAFSVHFGRLFLPYVLVFGMSVYALIGGLSTFDATAVKARFTVGVPVRSTAVVLIVIGWAFYLLWLSEVVPASISGTVPKATRDAGLLTNPVHVLDMGVLLPAAILAGVLLMRRQAWGYVLAPTILGCLIFISTGIVAAMLVLAARQQEAPVGVTVGVAALTVVEVVMLIRFLIAMTGDARTL